MDGGKVASFKVGLDGEGLGVIRGLGRLLVSYLIGVAFGELDVGRCFSFLFGKAGEHYKL